MRGWILAECEEKNSLGAAVRCYRFSYFSSGMGNGSAVCDVLAWLEYFGWVG